MGELRNQIMFVLVSMEIVILDKSTWDKPFDLLHVALVA